MTPTDTKLKTLDDLKGQTLVTPDPDSITAVMVRAMFRSREARRDGGARTAADDGAGHHDALSGCRAVLHRERLRERGATAANAVVKQWTDKGGKVLVPVAAGADQADHRVDQDVGGRAQRIRDALLTLRDSKPGRDALEAVGYGASSLPNADFESSTIAWLGL